MPVRLRPRALIIIMYLHPCFSIALSYLLAKQRSSFSLLTQRLAMLGSGIGICVLLVITSVFNGFYEELTRLDAHNNNVIIAYSSTSQTSWKSLASSLKNDSNVADTVPKRIQYGVIVQDTHKIIPVVIEGIEEHFAPSWFPVSTKHTIIPIACSDYLANSLYLEKGDNFNVHTALGSSAAPVLKNLRVSYNTRAPHTTSAMQNFHIYMPLSMMNKQLGFNKQSVSALYINTTKDADASSLALRWNKQYPSWSFDVSTSIESHMLSSLAAQKRLMIAVLSLVVVMAGFNVIASLTIVVSERKKEIALLRTLGFSKKHIVAIFLLQGSMIACVGILLGLLVGIPMAIYANDLLLGIEYILGYKLVTKDVFMLSYLPSSLYVVDSVYISLGTLLLTLCSAYFPARYACSIEPALCLRYED